MSDKMREEFEEWARSRSLDLAYRNYPGVGQFYECPRTLLALEAWQASRESLVVELPACEEGRCDSILEEAAQESYNDALAECRRAIESLGLRVKP